MTAAARRRLADNLSFRLSLQCTLQHAAAARGAAQPTEPPMQLWQDSLPTL
jgi:hypothetical protein